MTIEAAPLVAGLRREVLADGVYEAIKSLIMDRRIEPGAKINMDRVARDLSVSPTPVREALARLEADGLVTKRALVGYTAAPLLDAVGLRELFALRLLVEPAGARWAAGALDKADAARFPKMVNEVRNATKKSQGEDYQAYRLVVAHDRQFHEAVAEASGNKLLLQTLRRWQPHAQMYRLYFKKGFDRATLDEHTAIARALHRRDAEAAAEATSVHLRKAHERVLSALAANSQD